MKLCTPGSTNPGSPLAVNAMVARCIRFASHLSRGFGFVALLLALLLPMHLLGQSSTASLSGTITDLSGAVVPDAAVSIAATATGTSHTVSSNAEGLFNFPLLQPGNYSLTITKPGFSTAQRANIELQVNQAANVSIALAVGSEAQTVQVSGQAPILDTQTVSLGAVIGAQEINDLPLDGRQFAQLLQLVPGTVPVSVSQTGSALPLGSGSTNPSINGGSNRSNLFFINGVFATNPTYSYYALSPSVDAIQEFQEQTHADEAEFGQSLGGDINIATKSGTNQYHGNVYEFIRNDALDAASYFSPTKGAYKQNQFGGTIGGPILHNKLFGFGYYEGYRSIAAANNRAVLPTAAELGGDFSALLPNTVIYDPATYNAATHAIAPFTGNVIPTARLNQPLIAALKAFLPANLPTGPSDVLNYTNTESATIHQNDFGIRVDYDLGSKDLIFGQYFYQLGLQSTPATLGGNPFVAFAGGKNAGLNWIHTFSSSLTTQLTGGWLRATSPGYYVQNNPTALFNSSGFAQGFTTNPGDIAMPFVPSISTSGYFSINSGEGGDVDTVYQYSGSVNKQAGAHALRFGAAFYRATLATNYANDGESYNQQATWSPCASTLDGACVGTGGNALASTLLGLPDSATRQLGDSRANLLAHVIGMYAQDTWKVNNKLALNYGLRWDYTSPITDALNRLSGFNQHNGMWYIPRGDANAPTTPLPAGVYVASTNHITQNDYKNFSPRLGVAYTLFPKTAIRAGAGIFFDNWAGAIQAAQNARGGWPSGGSQSVNNTNVAGLTTPGATAQNPFGNLAPVQPDTPFPSGATFLDTAWRNAYSLEWNLEVEQQLSNSEVLSFAYTGSSTSRGTISNPNNQSLVLGPTQDLPFPQMSSFGELSSIAHLSYNSFQAKYEKRYASGLALKGAFTWSHDIDVGCADFWEGCTIQNGRNLAAERADSALDVPIVATFSTVYKLPFGKGQKYLTNEPASALVGGWHLNEIFSFRSGTPYTPGINFDNANANGGSQRPNLVGDPNAGGHSLNRWFNTSAYAVPTPYTYGNAGRDSLRGPRYTNLDASLFRDFNLFREASLQFRAEFFNILNHPQFANPDSTFEDSSFGQVTSITGNPRQIQFALKINF